MGAGVAGLVTATVLMERGAEVSIVDRGDPAGRASHFAGGMLARWCEATDAPPELAGLSAGAVAWWAAHVPQTQRHGSLVVAPRRDAAELLRFARRTSHHQWLDAEAIARLEPDLSGRFQQALYFEDEAHLDPRAALAELSSALMRRGAHQHAGDADALDHGAFDRIVDCRGHAAVDALPALRGVRGEMLLLRCPDVSLARPVRLLHPRIPIYIVPRPGNIFMVGATMIESASRAPISARSTMELLNAAYALHPGFGEAEILEAGVNLRPSFPDNMPRISEEGRTLRLNGMYRHGFLLSPAFATRIGDIVFPEGSSGDE
jgi:glycine oxidase